MKILSIANQKGGVGKSTTVQALGAGLSLRGYRVLLVDLDPQGNITYASGLDDFDKTAYDMLVNKTAAADIIVKTQNVHIIPAGRDLIKANLELTATGKEYRLKEALAPIKRNYDFIIIDTPPALGILTINALTASSQIIIPAQADIYSLQGIGQLTDAIGAVKKYCNQSLKIQGILLTRYNKRAVLSRDLAEMMESTAKHIKTFVYKTVIRECIAIKEAQAERTDIFAYASKSNASLDYSAFIDELIERMGLHA